MTGGSSTPKPQTSAVIRAGEQLIFTFSGGGNGLILSTPGFQGYLIVECRFKAAGAVFISDMGNKVFGTCYIAHVL